MLKFTLPLIVIFTRYIIRIRDRISLLLPSLSWRCRSHLFLENLAKSQYFFSPPLTLAPPLCFAPLISLSLSAHKATTLLSRVFCHFLYDLRKRKSKIKGWPLCRVHTSRWFIALRQWSHWNWKQTNFKLDKIRYIFHLPLSVKITGLAIWTLSLGHHALIPFPLHFQESKRRLASLIHQYLLQLQTYTCIVASYMKVSFFMLVSISLFLIPLCNFFSRIEIYERPKADIYHHMRYFFSIFSKNISIFCLF
jgi:hypothetical protein